MGILEKIQEIEKEISRTQKNKGKNMKNDGVLFKSVELVKKVKRHIWDYGVETVCYFYFLVFLHFLIFFSFLMTVNLFLLSKM